MLWTYNILLSILGVTKNTMAHFYDLVRVPVNIVIYFGGTIQISISNGDVTL